MKINYKAKKLLSYIVKITIVICSLYFIYSEIFKNENFESIILSFQTAIQEPKNIFLLIPVIVLMPINWILESKKWKFLISKIEEISIIDSLKAVFTGLTISAFVPSRAGEFLGRITYVKSADRVKASLITILGSFGQLTITITMGALATVICLLGFSFWEIEEVIKIPLLILFSIIALMTPILYLNSSVLGYLLNQLPFLRKFQEYIDVFKMYSSKDLWTVLSYSLSRYLIFTLQFILLLYFFNVSISPANAIMSVALIFFTLATIPTTLLYELGVREAVSIYFIGLLSADKLGVISATFSLWLVNIAIPAIIGSIYVFSAKILKPGSR